MKRNSSSGLIRALSLGSLIIYGVGDILGAGIYALVGKIAGHAGSLAWVSFAIAMGIISFTALSYSELGSRFPKSGGVSIYIHEAFGTQWFSILTGLLLFCATILSISTLSHAFAGYLRALGLNIPSIFDVFGFLILLLFINLRGIKQSSIANIISTTVEVSGLFIVLGCGFWYLATHDNSVIATSTESPGIGNVLQGTALAFFAFTGFEDMANIAEEVKEPKKNLPRAILSSVGIAGFLYLGVSWIATTIIPGSELSYSEAPLLDVVSKSAPALPKSLFSIIAIFAVSNSALLNYITASRLLYGMSKENLLPKLLQRVHPKFHTPYSAIFLIFPIVLCLVFTSNLGDLASSTSAIVLIVFSLSNLALIKIKLSTKKEHMSSKIFRIPLLIPCFAIVLNLAAISFLPLYNIIPAAVLIGICSFITWVIMKVLLSKK